MKKLIVIASMIICLFFSSCFLYFFRDTSLGGWEIVGEQYLPEENISGIDLLYDPVNGPLLVLLFPEGFLADGSLCVIPTWTEASVFAWRSGAWENIEDSGFSDLWNKTAGFSDDGEVYLVLEDPENEYALSVYQYDGSTWTILGTVGQFGAATDAWIGFNSMGEPLFLSCDYDYETGYSFQMDRWTGSDWEALANFPEWVITPYLCSNPIVSSASQMWCLVRDDSDGYPDVRTLEYIDDNWIMVGADPLSGGGASAEDTLIDSDGNPIVALSEINAFNEMTVLRYREEAWETLGIRGFTFGDAADSGAMVLGGDGYLYLAYRAVGHENAASVMRYPMVQD
jgi:hypothetical protein